MRHLCRSIPAARRVCVGDRLAARYGTAATLSLDNAAEGGAIITVRLPLVLGESASMGSRKPLPHSARAASLDGAL